MNEVKACVLLPCVALLCVFCAGGADGCGAERCGSIGCRPGECDGCDVWHLLPPEASPQQPGHGDAVLLVVQRLGREGGAGGRLSAWLLYLEVGVCFWWCGVVECAGEADGSRCGAQCWDSHGCSPGGRTDCGVRAGFTLQSKRGPLQQGDAATVQGCV